MSARVHASPYAAVAAKWRALADRRCAHFVELFCSGRWKHYYSEEQFVVRLREVIRAAETWAKLADRSGEGAAPPD
jgi:uncharacterized repeat protein (TIGR03809 family)